MPMISHILHLLVIDILAVGVAMRRSVEMPVTPAIEPARDEEGLSDVDVQQRRSAREAGGALAMARLTAHSR
jgi:glucokinase